VHKDLAESSPSMSLAGGGWRRAVNRQSLIMTTGVFWQPSAEPRWPHGSGRGSVPSRRHGDHTPRRGHATMVMIVG
jgi:hypothetical protein